MRYLLYILLLFPLISVAQTRLYATGSASSVSPAPNAGWNVTSGSSVILVTPYLTGTTGGNTSASTGGAAVKKVLMRQYVTAPLQAQTVNCTFTGQIRLKISTTGGGVTGQGFAYLRLINTDGTIASELGTLTTTNLTTTLTNRTIISLTITALAVTLGQRFCLDLGGNYSAGAVGSVTFQNATTSSGTADIPVDNTTTSSTLNTWFQFSQTLYFLNQNNFF